MMKTMILSVLAVCALSATASAQEISSYSFVRSSAADQTPQIAPDRFWIADRASVAVQGKVTTNAPYTAEAITESVMALADGNRIVRKTTTKVYRDSAGRTRQETVGPDGQVTTIVITDPVAKTSLVLDPRTQTANRGSVVSFTVVRTDSGKTEGRTIVHQSGDQATAMTVVSGKPLAADAGQTQRIERSVIVRAGEGGVFRIESSDTTADDTTKEDLGEQTIDGVMAKGTRMTTVIPAGAVDNELPIKIVSEEWVSPDLQVLVMTRHSDPRVGDTTYRLTNVTRAEPAPSLFELPVGFTLKTPDQK
jgi:hypothetical protein